MGNAKRTLGHKVGSVAGEALAGAAGGMMRATVSRLRERGKVFEDERREPSEPREDSEGSSEEPDGPRGETRGQTSSKGHTSTKGQSSTKENA